MGCASAYDFHHPDPDQKDFGIGSGNYKSFDKLKSELDKTVLLCANCHRTVHDEINVEKYKAKKAEFVSEPKPKKGSPPKKERLKRTSFCKMCGKEFTVVPGRQRHCSVECAAKSSEVIAWPTDAELGAMVWGVSVLQLSRRLGVSEVAIKKRCKGRGINTPPRGYWSSKRRLIPG